MQFAASKAEYLKAGGKLHKYPDPILVSKEYSKKQDEDINEFLDFFAKNKGKVQFETVESIGEK